MDIDEQRELRFEMNRMFRDADWDAKYEAKMRILNAQKRVGLNGNIYIKREGGNTCLKLR
jgi:hypothetical protein